MATAVHLAQEDLKRAANAANIDRWGGNLRRYAAVDKAVIDQSGSMRREESKCTRGKFMFWNLMSGEPGKELEFVILVPTDSKRLRGRASGPTRGCITITQTTDMSTAKYI